VLTRVRRAVTLAMSVIVPVLPVIIVIGEGAKRWH
jgi:hypothetical protein